MDRKEEGYSEIPVSGQAVGAPQQSVNPLKPLAIIVTAGTVAGGVATPWQTIDLTSGNPQEPGQRERIPMVPAVDQFLDQADAVMDVYDRCGTAKAEDLIAELTRRREARRTQAPNHILPRGDVPAAQGGVELPDMGNSVPALPDPGASEESPMAADYITEKHLNLALDPLKDGVKELKADITSIKQSAATIERTVGILTTVINNVDQNQKDLKNDVWKAAALTGGVVALITAIAKFVN